MTEANDRETSHAGSKAATPKAGRFLLVYGAALILSGLCTWLFGATLLESYPDGILVYPPEGNNPPRASDALHIGMAIGFFFSCLVTAVIALTILGLNTFKTTVLRHWPAPLFSASATCVVLLFTALHFAG